MSQLAPLGFRNQEGGLLAGEALGPPDGEVVLLLHGGGQTRHAWRKAQAKLAGAGYHAITLDQRGHGDSDWSQRQEYQLPFYAADVRGVIDQLGEPVFMVGASLGGKAALLAASEATELNVRGVILVDVVHRPDMTGALVIRDFMAARPEGFASLEEAADAVSAFRPGSKPVSDHSGLARNLRQHPDGRWRWHWDPAFLLGDGRFTFDSDRIATAAATLRAPLLLIRGGQSEIVSEELAAEFRRIAPQAEYVNVPGATHMVAGEDNDVFTAAVLDFLRRH